MRVTQFVLGPAEKAVRDDREQRIPVIEERARLDKRSVERGVVKISTSVAEHQEILSGTLHREDVEIERIAVNRPIESMPEIRQEDDVIVIPVVEERAVVTKQLVLVEEWRVHRRTERRTVDIPVTLQSTEVSVEREPRVNEQSGPTE